MGKFNPSQEYFRSIIHYNPLTGILYRRKKFESGLIKPLGHKCTKGRDRLMVSLKLNGVSAGFLAHRIAWIIMNGQIPDGLEIDHINGVTDDNRIANLRCVTRKVNMQNLRKPNRNSVSGLLGAFPSKGGKWVAAICVNGKQRRIGTFATKEDAHQAYVIKKREVHEGCTI